MRHVLLAAAGLLLSMPAFAKVVTYEYTGIVDTIAKNSLAGDELLQTSSAIPGSVSVGDPFHGRISYDDAVPMSRFPFVGNLIGYPGGPGYEVPAGSFVFDKSGTSFASSTASPPLSVYKDDMVTVVSIGPNGESPSSIGTFSFLFIGSQPDPMPVLAFPDKITLADYYSPTVIFHWDGADEPLYVGGALTSFTNVPSGPSVSPVPEPDAYMFWVAGAALAGAGSLRKRYRGKAR